jgi:hypothetical protein
VDNLAKENERANHKTAWAFFDSGAKGYRGGQFLPITMTHAIFQS